MTKIPAHRLPTEVRLIEPTPAIFYEARMFGEAGTREVAYALQERADKHNATVICCLWDSTLIAQPGGDAEAILNDLTFGYVGRSK